jgi:hypothetical protein
MSQTRLDRAQGALPSSSAEGRQRLGCGAGGARPVHSIGWQGAVLGCAFRRPGWWQTGGGRGGVTRRAERSHNRHPPSSAGTSRSPTRSA